MSFPSCRLYLLDEELISVGGGRRLSLAGLFAAMARGERVEFAALRPHQRPAWHMFLVQLAALALWTGGQTDPPTDAASWRDLLSRLTPDFPDGEPWCLVVADRSKPAFLQPPDPGGLKWIPVTTPDALDMLITARNHDLKQGVMYQAAPEDWLFALVSLQTQNIYNMQYPGTIRGKTNASSRAILARAPAIDDDLTRGIDSSKWWRSETRVLLSSRSALPPKHGARHVSLLWTVNWPVGGQIDFFELDDWFVEITNRVRMTTSAGRLIVQKVAGQKSRVDRAPITKKLNSQNVIVATKDPWAAVNIPDGFPFNLGRGSFKYNTIARILFSGNWKYPLVWSKAEPGESKPQFLVFESLKVVDASKTAGFESRIIPIPAGIVERFGAPAMKVLADQQIRDIALVEGILKHAIFVILGDGDLREDGEKGKVAKEKEKHAKLRPNRKPLHPAGLIGSAFDRRADALFFPALWEAVGANLQGPAALRAAQMRFRAALRDAAIAEFEAALPAVPSAAIFRPRAEARARRVLFGDLWKGGFRPAEEQEDTAHEHA